MSIQLNEGVHLHVLPTKKYKTVRLVIKFRAPLKAETITNRAMLSSLLETNSKKYPTQTELRSTLANLYGASFGLSVTKKGTEHMFTVGMNLVNERYLSEKTNILNDGIALLEEIIFNPNVANGQFDEGTFNREKENLLDYYSSIYDDKQAYASLSLQSLYFEDEDQKMPSIGTAEELEKITATSLFAYYQKMLQEDTIDIYVLGDVDENDIELAFRKFPFTPRKKATGSVFYQEPTRNNLKNEVEKQEVTQAKYNLAYETNTYYLEKDYFALQVFNGIFGGFPHSKLFVNVREKESLAYYASSSLDTFRGMMTVQTGIESAKVQQVSDIISVQLNEVQIGNFEEEAINQTKEMLKNQILQSEDNAPAFIERLYIYDIVGKNLSVDEWQAQVDAVTKEEIIAVANKIQLKATFFLTGEV
ncbi:EF-P 5-aminopentanol modification-associated protein YfmF [Carnobacterium gallinarum]|uniref:EF-P 5-aminopentanol modification-associated protein YfmF n=1 Tax=Carnobacterium gallinarum TaxID=2749 RepID=UPI00054FC262|nr:pitrilysin family protein [Carnobacterium gallinarum]